MGATKLTIYASIVFGLCVFVCSGCFTNWKYQYRPADRTDTEVWAALDSSMVCVTCKTISDDVLNDSVTLCYGISQVYTGTDIPSGFVGVYGQISLENRGTKVSSMGLYDLRLRVGEDTYAVHESLGTLFTVYPGMESSAEIIFVVPQLKIEKANSIYLLGHYGAEIFSFEFTKMPLREETHIKRNGSAGPM